MKMQCMQMTACQNDFFLFELINRISGRVVFRSVFKIMTYLNSLKPCMIFFRFEAVTKT